MPFTHKYLGLVLNEFLDFRALSLLISKRKSAEGMPFGVFTKLYDSMVWPVIAYGAAV